MTCTLSPISLIKVAIQNVIHRPQDFASTRHWTEMQNQSLLEIY